MQNGKQSKDKESDMAYELSTIGKTGGVSSGKKVTIGLKLPFENSPETIECAAPNTFLVRGDVFVTLETCGPDAEENPEGQVATHQIQRAPATTGNLTITPDHLVLRLSFEDDGEIARRLEPFKFADCRVVIEPRSDPQG